MRRSSRDALFWIAGLLVGGPLLGFRPAWGQAAPPSPVTASNSVVATIAGLRNNTGVVRMSIYDGPARWPRVGGGLECRQRIANRQSTCTFGNVQPGHVYAIAVAHDENDNGHVDTNWIGIPTEGYGFSNNARPFMSAPGFDACRFTYPGGVFNVRMVAQY